MQDRMTRIDELETLLTAIKEMPDADPKELIRQRLIELDTDNA